MTAKLATQSKSSKKLGRYAGEWVVFVNRKIVAHNKTLTKAMKEAERLGLASKASVFRVPRRDEGPYVLLIVT